MVSQPIIPQAKQNGHSWWAARWQRALALMLDTSRLAEGRAYACAGRVASVDVQIGLILGRVKSGADAGSCHVRIAVNTLSDVQWEQIIAQMSGRAIYAAQLVNGEMPEDIETVFEAAGAFLFPQRGDDLKPECSCSDWPSACKHVVAVYHELGELVSGDPFQLFTMRGRTREQILAALRERRVSQAAALLLANDEDVFEQDSDPAALPADAARFWALDEDLHAIHIRVEPPEVQTELLKVLGELSFVENREIRQQLEEVYRNVSQHAVKTAYEDLGDEEEM